MNIALTVKKLVFSALLAAMSLTLYVVEGMIPPVIPIPGFRIGLAYFPILFTMYLGGHWKAYDAALILITRVLLSALISGNVTALLFSLSGGMLSFVAMAVTHRFIKEPWGAFPAGIFSAVMHNVGQIATASLIYSVSVFAYLPFLVIAAVLTGTFIAAVVWQILRKSNRIISKIRNTE